MRRELVNFLSKKMKEDPLIYLITGDVGQYIFNNISKEYSKRFWNFGIMEQATIAHLAGMALQGLKPWFYTITPFALERPYEFIKLDIVEQNANVKIVGYWAYEDAGITHKTKNVKGLCKELGIKCYEPKNTKETRETLKEAYQIVGPAFISLKRDFDKKW